MAFDGVGLAVQHPGAARAAVHHQQLVGRGHVEQAVRDLDLIGQGLDAISGGELEDLEPLALLAGQEQPVAGGVDLEVVEVALVAGDVDAARHRQGRAGRRRGGGRLLEVGGLVAGRDDGEEGA